MPFKAHVSPWPFQYIHSVIKAYGQTLPRENRASDVLISIIIPTLNSAVNISYALMSIASQSFRNFEVIVSDGGSSDQTIELATKILNSHAIKHTIIRRDGSSIYGALNLGARIAHGEWIYCIGCDDKFASQSTLHEVHQTLIENNHNVVYGGVVNAAEGGLVMNWPYTAKSLARMSIPHQATFYRRSFLIKHNLEYSEDYPIEADWDLNLRLWKLTKFHHIDLIIAIYGGGGVSSPHRQPASPLKDNLAAVLLQYYGLRAFCFMPSFRLAEACRGHPNIVYRIIFPVIRARDALVRFLM